MTTMTTLQLLVRVDDRVRLMSALLSVTTWPETEQTRKRHRAHVHARTTTRHIGALREHDAVKTLQTLLDKGTPLEAVYTYALNLSWPELTLNTPMPWAPLHWNEQMGDFFIKTRLGEWWAAERFAWQTAQDQIKKVIDKVDLYAFFKPFIGDVSERLVLMPNISYPSDTEIGVRMGNELLCVAPPRIAWGDNEPWPFDEDEAHIYRGALSEYGRLLMVAYLRQNAAAVAPVATSPLPVSDKFRETYTTWGDQFTGLFVSGAVALFLEEIDPQEAKAYILMENRVSGNTIVPGVVSVLKRYLEEHRENRYAELADFLVNFPKHLRVAKRVVSL